jgi:hypothetical protein
MPLTWQIGKTTGRCGTGNWGASPPPLEEVFAAAKSWAPALRGIDRPWLCWSVDPDWCLVQQRLVLEVGWTPVVGSDSGAAPPLLPGAVFVDFNRRLRLPGMWMHFPLELAFLFCDRLAFWHSDLLPSLDVMWELDRRFSAAEDGQTLAVRCDHGWRRRLRHWLRLEREPRRFYELVGLTTRAASRDQFERGCGWWRQIQRHPNYRAGDPSPHWEHGHGIHVWKTRFDGDVVEIDVRGLDRHHYSMLTKKGYRRLESKADELRQYDLDGIIADLGFWEPVDLAGLRAEAAREAASVGP